MPDACRGDLRSKSPPKMLQTGALISGARVGEPGRPRTEERSFLGAKRRDNKNGLDFDLGAFDLVQRQDRFQFEGGTVWSMKTPIFVRSLSEEELESLEKGLRSKNTFTMRRSQMLLASSRGERAPKIALNLGCASQTVRDAIRDFNHRALDALDRKSSRPRKTRDAFDEKGAERLRGMLHRSPREFGTLLECVDFGDGRRCGLRGGADRGARKRGDRAGDAFAGSGGSLDAGQALDHLCRPPLRKKKGGASG